MKNVLTTVSKQVREFRDYPDLLEIWHAQHGYRIALAKEVPITGRVTRARDIKCIDSMPSRCKAFGAYTSLCRIHARIECGLPLHPPRIDKYGRMMDGVGRTAYFLAHNMPCLVDMMEYLEHNHG